MTPGAPAAARRHGQRAERTLLRIHLGDADHFAGKPAYEAIVRLLRERGLAGATVTRGVTGFGASRAIHSTVSEVGALDLPVLIECVDTEEHIRGVLPDLDSMVSGGVMTLERAEVIIYRADPARGDAAGGG